MDYDIVIVGGGLVGASLAAALKGSGLSIALVEGRPPAPLGTSPLPTPLPQAGEGANESPDKTLPDNWDSRIYAISPGCRTWLERIGAWQHLDAARVAPVEQMRVFGDGGSELDFSAYQMGAPELACILESRLLQDALWQALGRQDNLNIVCPAKCTALEVTAQSACLTLEDGRVLAAKLVVGADGRDSWVRNRAGLGATPLDYRHHGVVANFTCELSHRNIAYQWFQPDEILALLPLPGRRISIVWSASPQRSAELMALTHDELCARVTEASHRTLGELSLITPPAAFPLRLLVLPQISAPRVALVGDAAHNMHPLAGQGVNTGFRDARQLAQVLLERGPADCGDAQLLRRYDRKRKEDIYSMQATTYGLRHLFGNDDPVLRALRNTGMNATNHLAPVKKMLMQHAFL